IAASSSGAPRSRTRRQSNGCGFNCCPSRSSSWLSVFLVLRSLRGDGSPQFSQSRANRIITRGKCQSLSQCPDGFRLVPGAIGREPEIAHQVGHFRVPSLRFLVVSESYGILLLHGFDRGQITEGAAQNRTQEFFLGRCLSLLALRQLGVRKRIAAYGCGRILARPPQRNR